MLAMNRKRFSFALAGAVAIIIICLTDVVFSAAEETKENNNSDSNTKIARACPNGCSGHGVCSGNTCQCQPGFMGSDCSIATTLLTSGQALPRQTVDRYLWVYYSIPVLYSENSLVVVLNETTQGDADLYIQLNDLPTRNSYYKRDISTQPNMALTVDNVQTGTWYIGVYGFSPVVFTIKASVIANCPNSCSNHGSCLNGACLCNTGYVGADCSAAVTTIQDNSPIQANVATDSWNYYVYNFRTGNIILVNLNQLNAGDCDIYIRYSDVPTHWSYTSSNISVDNITTLTIPDPLPGAWYIGVYGFESCRYSLTVTTKQVCPNNCTFHGTCLSSTSCRCDDNWQGDYCESRKSPLRNGEVERGFVDTGNWNFFKYICNTTNDLIVTITQTSTTGDCDLYAKARTRPTSFFYDFAEISTERSFNMTIHEPGRDTWIIGVYGWSSCAYNIAVMELPSNQCPNGCNGRGTCNQGTCVCQAPYFGEDCSSTVAALSPNIIRRGDTIRKFEWKYYSYTASDTSSLLAQVREQTTSGYLWVYVSKSVPTLRDYLKSDTNDIHHIHRIELNLPEGELNTYIIGVYGNPYIPPDVTVKYDIIAWAPNF